MNTINHKRKTTKSFVLDSKNKFGDMFGYSLTKYHNNATDISITCNKCRHITTHKPNTHLSTKYKGCYNCLKIKKLQIYSDNFIINAVLQHDTLYDYSLVKYIKSDKKVDILCKNCNLIFHQSPNNHLSGHGCPDCNQGYKGLFHTIETYRNRKTTLYYIKIGDIYKIGLTLESVKRRYSNDRVKIDIIKEWIFEDGSIAYNLEKKILKDNIQYQYQGVNILKGGNSELFSKDILVSIQHIKSLKIG